MSSALRTAREAEQAAEGSLWNAMRPPGAHGIPALPMLDVIRARRATDEALIAAVIERCAQRIEGGSFLHEEAPDARLAQSAAKALRSLDHAALLADLEKEDR